MFIGDHRGKNSFLKKSFSQLCLCINSNNGKYIPNSESQLKKFEKHSSRGPGNSGGRQFSFLRFYFPNTSLYIYPIFPFFSYLSLFFFFLFCFSLLFLFLPLCFSFSVIVSLSGNHCFTPYLSHSNICSLTHMRVCNLTMNWDSMGLILYIASHINEPRPAAKSNFTFISILPAYLKA